MKPGTSQDEAISAINSAAADCFDEIVRLLGSRNPSDFRIAAYRRGSAALRELLCPIDRIYADSGREGLEEIRGFTRSLALSIERYLQTGLMPTLELLRGNGLPPRLMRSPENSRSRSHQLTATVDRMSHAPVLDASPENSLVPSVEQLLSIDAEYRQKAGRGELTKIAPRQFNPTGARWLPVLHTRRDRWHYTASFSNTAHAHEAGMTADWVVIHRDVRGKSSHWTVITSRFGRLKNRRIVRGRETECLHFYQQRSGYGAETADRQQRQLTQQKLLFDVD